jgi:hypothetical protein
VVGGSVAGVVAGIEAGTGVSYDTGFTALASLSALVLDGCRAFATSVVFEAVGPTRVLRSSMLAVLPAGGVVPGKVCREGDDMMTSPV